MARRDDILREAARLFARRGFHGVTIAEIGAACGVSGPALYKHVAGKEAILAEMLVEISRRLLDEGRRRTTDVEPGAALDALIEWHVGFALDHPELIVVQDREWAALPDAAREEVRALQRAYVEVWVGTLLAVREDLTPPAARAVVHATFGLINSTPHSAVVPATRMRALLPPMARAALLAGRPVVAI